ncbi:MAG TPA: hypothetical protein VKA30_07965, partial [Actinomycetota bacterium]|nr:hypothetical protein [Actinomycetota bacterium]
MSLAALPVFLGAPFERPTTKDFVWPCWGPNVSVGGIDFCYNFVFFVMTLAIVAMVLFFLIGLRRPKLIPGKFQLMCEAGVDFV